MQLQPSAPQQAAMQCAAVFSYDSLPAGFLSRIIVRARRHARHITNDATC